MTQEEKCYGTIPFIIIDGKINFLIVKHNRWHWWFPKWHLEIWESEEQTAKRETKEEIWIENIKILKDHKFTDIYNVFVDGKKKEKTVTLFLWEISVESLSKIDLSISGGETVDFSVGDYKRISNLLTFDSSKEILKKAWKILSYRVW